ncbi:MAG: ATP synthase subunit I [Oscillospiraceae bacterium]|nr:ATP synthase subunit I [Oscillospiraceae bacterium]
MLESRKIVFQETAVVLIGELLCTGIMYGIYGLLSLFTVKVLLGGLLGCLLAVLNFFFMAVSASLASDKAQQQDVEGGQKLMRTSMLLRHLLLFVVLIAAAVSKYFDLIALLLPLLFVRPVLTLAEFFKKKGA